MSPSVAAQAVRESYKQAPDGKVGVVSAPGQEGYDSPLQKIASIAAGFVRSAGKAVKDSITSPNPVNIFVPGGTLAARAAAEGAKLAGQGIKSAGEGVKSAAGAASQGVEKGFKYATLILVLAVGVYLWSIFRPRG